MTPNKINGKPIENFLAEKKVIADLETVRAFLRFLKRRTQFRHEFTYNKKEPLLTVIPENAFDIYYKAFVQGEEERRLVMQNQPKLNQEELFPMQ